MLCFKYRSSLGKNALHCEICLSSDLLIHLYNSGIPSNNEHLLPEQGIHLMYLLFFQKLHPSQKYQTVIYRIKFEYFASHQLRNIGKHDSTYEKRFSILLKKYWGEQWNFLEYYRNWFVKQCIIYLNIWGAHSKTLFSLSIHRVSHGLTIKKALSIYSSKWCI